MSVRETILIGEPVLRETAALVKDPTNHAIQSIIGDCVDTMRSEELAGLAAPQLGESMRVIVYEIRKTKYRNPEEVHDLTVCINPDIAERSEETEVGYEGCGSIPGLFGQVERACSISYTYQDQTGKWHKDTAHGLLARVIQHEIDHLNGILFTDLADPKTFVSREYYLENIK